MATKSIIVINSSYFGYGRIIKVFRYIAFSNFIARRCQSAGCTGNKMNAFLMSILDNNVYVPVVILWFMTSSTEI